MESDARVNKADYPWTTNAGSASCSNRFGLESVMTHERGHTFGLGHLNSSTLTMRPRLPCGHAHRAGRLEPLALPERLAGHLWGAAEIR